MRCAWKELLSILPFSIRGEVDSMGKDKLQEVRLRLNTPAELVLDKHSHWLNHEITHDDLNFCINAASRYSPWSAASASSGYITAAGGHRIGLCGNVVCKNGIVTGVREITSVCIRVAKDFPGIGKPLSTHRGSILILGAPGWGKTTLMRDLIRLRSDAGEHIGVVDERSELFPEGFTQGKRTDVLTNCPKPEGIPMLLRTMGPDCIAVDEITAPEDAMALVGAAWCGVKLLATAHASSLQDFLTRPVYAQLAKNNLFDTIVILHQDKSWHTERSYQWNSNGSGQF